jgi:hypothetical protein
MGLERGGQVVIDVVIMARDEGKRGHGHCIDDILMIFYPILRINASTYV